MALRIDDLGLKRLPTLPETVPVFEVSAPPFADRRAGIARLSDFLGLGDLRPLELDHALVLAGERGEIEYFHASGAVWARDATAANEQRTELRKWEGVEEAKQPDQRVRLSRDAADKLLAQAREILEATGLIGREAVSGGAVALDQVARLDAKGKEVAFGAGQATVKLSYAVEGLAVTGAGAKTLVFADPGSSGQARFNGAFHCWRTLGSAGAVKVPSIEQALGVGLLTDPELDLYRRAGHTIRIRRLDFAYLALPAFIRQSHLFPVLQVEGSVSEGKHGAGFDFARYHHAIPPKAYAAADLYGPYLSANPDGIAPRSRQRRG